ncbi:MAG: recombinase family protein, partial [bacterium]
MQVSKKQIMQCAIYTRVSTDSQAEVEFNSCEAQQERIKSFIKSQETFKLYKIYNDPGFTGAHMDRPALKQMFSDIQSGLINVV